MSIQFEWQAQNDEGDWESLSPRRPRRRLPRWVWWTALTVVLVVAATVTLVVRRRYRRAIEGITFQIQSVIDLETAALARGDEARYLAQQDASAEGWYAAQERLIEARHAQIDEKPDEEILPVEAEEVGLHGDVAWVEVVEGDEPVRRVRFYRQVDGGWLHTAPDPSFWGAPIEAHFTRKTVAGSQRNQALASERLIVRYHRRDQPYLDPVADRLGTTFYEVCAVVGCVREEAFEVAFYVQAPTRTVPSHVILLPSPWLDGIPVKGTYGERATEASVHALARGLASASLSNYVIPPRTLRAAIVDEYATWVSTRDLARTPLLRRVIARHGTAALPELFAWLRHRPSLAGFFAAWLDVTAHGNEIAYFQALLDVEHEALFAGRANTFLSLHDGSRWRWTLSRKAFVTQLGEQPDRPAPPEVRVEAVEVGGGRARVTFETSPADIASPYIESPAYFRLRDGNWLHTYPPYAPYASGLWPRPAPPIESSDIVTVTFACWIPRSFRDRVNGFHEYYGWPGTRVTAEPGGRRYEAYPGIRVQLVDLAAYDLTATRDQLYDAQSFLAGLADAGVWPWAGEVVATDTVRDLRPYVDADASFGRADFFPHMIAPSGSGGEIWTLPVGATTRLISFDKDAFDAAGVPYPKPGWTHEDFLRTARLLTMHSGGETLRYGFVDLASSRRELILALVDPPQEHTGLAIPDLTAPDVVQAVQWYLDLALEHNVMPNPNHPPSLVEPTEPWQALNRLVIDGHAAMWSDYLGNWGERDRESRLGLVPFPTGTSQAQYWYSQGLFMSQDAAFPEAAWAWLRFLTHQPPDQHDIPLYQYYIPARQSVAEATGYWSRWDRDVADTLQHTLEHSSVYRWDASLAALSQAIEAAFGGTPVEEALAAAQASLQE